MSIRLVKSDTFHPDKPLIIPDKKLEALSAEYIEACCLHIDDRPPSFDQWLTSMGFA